MSSERKPVECSAGLDYDVSDQTATVRPWGVLDVCGTASIRPQMESALGLSVNHFLFDLSRVSFLDGSGLQELMRFRDAVFERGARMSVVNGGSSFLRLLSITKANRLLDPTATPG